MKVAILGGGNGGQTMAAELTLAGHEVALCEHPRFEAGIAAARTLGGITLSGPTANNVEPGFARVATITTDVAQAVSSARVIMVVMSAAGHRWFMEAMAPLLEDGQIVVFNPGYFATLEFATYLRRTQPQKPVILAETESLIYATRISGPAQVQVAAVKGELRYATLPARRMQEAHAIVRQLYPQFAPDINVLATSLNNINYINHPTSALLNASRIEQIGPYRYSAYDVTPSVARVMEAVDEERMNLAAALGLERISAPMMLQRFYGARGDDIYSTITDAYAYKDMMSPASLRYRYVTEDIPFGFVPMASLGLQLGVPTLAIDTMINLASLVNEEDYRAIGRNAERLGIQGLNASQIREYVAG